MTPIVVASAMLWAWSTCPECRDRRWTGVSSTHLARRFKELIGVTPKRLARTHRFAAAVLSIDPAGPVDWGDLAGGAGYFDQAHFGHEFRAFTGLTPTRCVEVRRRFLREHPGHVLDSWPLPAD